MPSPCWVELAEPMELYNMGYWYADFLRKATGTDIVIVPRKSLYDEPKSFAAGPVPVERIIGFLRDRRIVKFSMKGSDLIHYFSSPGVKDRFNPFHLEHRNAQWLYLAAGAYYYSGLQVAYHEDDESVTFDLNPEKTYTVATLWPFLQKDAAGYRYVKPSVEAASQGTVFPGLTLPEDKEVLAETTWDLLRRQGKHGSLIFHRPAQDATARVDAMDEELRRRGTRVSTQRPPTLNHRWPSGLFAYIFCAKLH